MLVEHRVQAQQPTLRLAELMTPRWSAERAHPLADERGRVPVLVALGAGEDARALGLLEVAPGVGAKRVALGDLPNFRAEHARRQTWAAPRTRPALEFSRKRSGIKAFVDATEGAGTGKGVVVGVVDTGIDLTHPAFQHEDGSTRIAWLLTWGEPEGLHPELEDEFGCTDPDQAPCAIFSAEDINQLVLPDATVKDAIGHGTHVASIAAGNGRREDGLGPLNVGVAPEATLVIAAPSSNGGFADDEVLRGTRFVFERADAMGLPAVVNLSLGGDFGPHDGTSLLESGTAAFVGDDKPGRVIVAASGNSGGLYQVGDTYPLGIHSSVRVEEHMPARLPIYVPGAGGNVFVWITFRPGDEVSVGLEGPDGARWISQIGPGDEAGYSDDDVEAAVINNLVNEHSSLTSDTNGAVISWNGAWAAESGFAITLEGRGDAEMWVTGASGAGDAMFVQANKQGTVNQPGSHPRLLTVGCTVNRLKWTSIDGAVAIETLGDEETAVDGACYFSGAGPTPLGVPKPEIAAPGGFIVGAMSEAADPRQAEGSMFDPGGCPKDGFCYVIDDFYAVATGTSMSAPHVAGAVALMLQQRADLTQAMVTEVLQASARKPAGATRYGSQMGAGALDVRHALAVLAEEGPSNEPPAAEQSFWFLSSETIKPDPSWTLTGSINLRRADGSIASGLDGSLLSVEVEGGNLARAPVKVLHGFYQFAVSASEGSGGKELVVRVRYDGEQIGEALVVPIAIDAWAAGAEPEARGGLSCGVSALAPHPPPWHWLALVGLCLARRARRDRP